MRAVCDDYWTDGTFTGLLWAIGLVLAGVTDVCLTSTGTWSLRGAVVIEHKVMMMEEVWGGGHEGTRWASDPTRWTPGWTERCRCWLLALPF